jgi:hypothetical protein
MKKIPLRPRCRRLLPEWCRLEGFWQRLARGLFRRRGGVSRQAPARFALEIEHLGQALSGRFAPPSARRTSRTHLAVEALEIRLVPSNADDVSITIHMNVSSPAYLIGGPPINGAVPLGWPDGDPQHGAVFVNGACGSWVYSPNANYIGPDAVAFTALDGNAATLWITVTDTAPTARDMSLSVTHGQTSGALDGLLWGTTWTAITLPQSTVVPPTALWLSKRTAPSTTRPTMIIPARIPSPITSTMAPIP